MSRRFAGLNGSGSVVETVASSRAFCWSGAVLALCLTAASLPAQVIPSISGISPGYALAGSSNQAITISGSGFISGSAVVWSGPFGNSSLQSTFVSSSQLQAIIPQGLMTSAGVNHISVSNGGSLQSNTVDFGVYPQVFSISPSSAAVGGGPITITVNGAGFTGSGILVDWYAPQSGNPASLPPTVMSSTQLQVSVPNSLLTPAGSATLFVGLTGCPNGTCGVSSQTFTVTAPQATLSVSPGSLTFTYQQGGSLPPAQTLSVSASTGTLNYTASSGNCTWLTLSPLSGATPGQISVSLNQTGANALTPSATPYTCPVTVSASGASNSPQTATVSLTVSAPPPSISSISPSSAQAGSGPFGLTLTGSNFGQNCTVQWSGTALGITFASATQINAQVPASLVAQQGTANVVAICSGLVSNSVTFTITASPTLSVTPGLLSFSYQQGAALPPAQNLSVSTTNATFNYSASAGNCSWLALAGASGTTPGQIAVGLNQAGVNALSPSATPYTCPVAVSAAGASNSPVSVTASVTITAAAPAISSISPNSVQAGGAAFPLSVSGSNFVANCTVQWNGTGLATTFNSAAQLTAQVPANLIAQQSTASVAVNCSTGTSNSVLFSITAPTPQTLSVTPGSVSYAYRQGLPLPPAQSISVSASSGVLNFTVSAGGCSWLTVNPLSGSTPGQFLAQLSQAGVTALSPSATPYTCTLTVSAAGATNSPQTVAASITVTAAPAVPSISVLTPSSAQAGGSSFTLAVSGANFAAGCTVQWNGGALSTAFVSATQLSAQVPASLIAQQGSANVTAVCSNGTSNAATFSITPAAPLPTLSVAPGGLSFSYQQGGSLPLSQSLSIASSSGVLSFTASAGGCPWLSLSPLSGNTPGQIAVSINQTGVSALGASATPYSCPISIGAAGASNSPQTATVSLTISAAVPSISSLTPNSAQAGSGAFSLVVFGSNFVPGCSVQWNGAALGTTFNSAAQLSAQVPASLIGQQGSATVTASCPAGASSGLTFSITAAAAPTLSVTPNSLAFSYILGSPVPPPLTLDVSASGAAPINFTASAATTSGGNWLAVTPSGTTRTSISVTVSTAGLGPRQTPYAGSITISAQGVASQIIPVTLSVGGQATLSVSPLSLTFAGQTGSTAHLTQNLTLTSNGVPVDVSVSKTGGGWLSVSPDLLTTPGTVVVTVDPSILPQGVTTGAVVLTPAGGTPQIVAVSVTLSLAPSLVVSPLSLDFSATAGDPTRPQPQSISIFSGAASTGFTITTGGSSWLSAAPVSGKTPGTIAVSVNPGTLAAAYTDQVTVSAPGANPSTQSVKVTLTVNAPTPPHIDVIPSAITLTAVQGGPPIQKQLTISNTGGGTTAFTAQLHFLSGAGWLTLDTASGQSRAGSPASVSLTFTPPAMAGTYTAEVLIHDADSQQDLIAPVTLSVSGAGRPQAIQLSQTGLGFMASAVEGTTSAKTFAVANAGQGSLDFTITKESVTGGVDWLLATAANATVTADLPSLISVSVRPAGLQPGRYYGVLRVDAPGAANSPQRFSVVLDVVAPSQGSPQASPTGVMLVSQPGDTNPATGQVTIDNPSGQPLTYVSSAITEDGNNWLAAVPASGTAAAGAPTQVTIQANVGTLPAAVRRGTIRIAFADGSVQTISVVSIVGSAGASATGNSAKGVRAASGCTPKALVLVFNAPESSFSASALAPLPLRIIGKDDCGNPMTDGSVNMSTGTDRLTLAHEGAGLWSTTWVPRTAGPVSLEATAFRLQGLSVLIAQLVLKGSIASATGTSGAVPTRVVNSASYLSPGTVAPGTWVSVFGQKLADSALPASQVPFPTKLGATQVMLGDLLLPLDYVSDTQVNAFVPFGLFPNTLHQLLVRRGETVSVPVGVTVATVQPALYALNQAGTGQGAILIASTGIVPAPAGTTSSSRPVHPGEYLEIYATGLGDVMNPPEGGALATGNPTVLNPTVTIGGNQANVLFSGLAPGLVGLYQVNVQVPLNTAAGDSIPVALTIGSVTSNVVTIAVQ